MMALQQNFKKVITKLCTQLIPTSTQLAATTSTLLEPKYRT